MVILGIDPGSRRIGYGAINASRRDPVLLEVGVFMITKKDEPAALEELRRKMEGLIERIRPDILAVEKLYFLKNKTSGVQVAQARGVILGIGAECGIEIREYAPNEVKAAIAGYGFADKKAIAKMVRIILKEPGLKAIDDATDALAVAIMAIRPHLSIGK